MLPKGKWLRVWGFSIDNRFGLCDVGVRVHDVSQKCSGKLPSRRTRMLTKACTSHRQVTILCCSLQDSSPIPHTDNSLTLNVLCSGSGALVFGLSGRAGGGLNVGLDRFDASWVLLMDKILHYPL